MSIASAEALEIPSLEITGRAGAPVIVALGGISANRHVCSGGDDPTPGWWETVAGSGRAIDTRRYRVAGFDFLDGGRGADGRPARNVSTRDQAEALAASLDAAGVERVHAVIGASYGGMVALAFAERFPDRLERLVVIGAAHRTHPMVTALRVIQRRIVEFGLETGRTHEALSLARSLAMTTFRTAREFAGRFASAPEQVLQSGAVFPVESYLRYHGERFAARWTPERFLALSLSADLHQVDPQAIRAVTTLVAADGDAIVPAEQTGELARLIGRRCRIARLRSDNGHDAFLTEPEGLGVILESALNASIS
jgi:homoserine O-acetyltransferase